MQAQRKSSGKAQQRQSTAAQKQRQSTASTTRARMRLPVEYEVQRGEDRSARRSAAPEESQRPKSTPLAVTDERWSYLGQLLGSGSTAEQHSKAAAQQSSTAEQQHSRAAAQAQQSRAAQQQSSATEFFDKPLHKMRERRIYECCPGSTTCCCKQRDFEEDKYLEGMPR